MYATHHTHDGERFPNNPHTDRCRACPKFANMGSALHHQSVMKRVDAMAEQNGTPYRIWSGHVSVG